MEMEGRRLRVVVGDGEALVPEFEGVAPFVHCFRGRTEGDRPLLRAGDLSVQEVPIVLPPRRDGSEETPAVARLRGFPYSEPAGRSPALTTGSDFSNRP